jgi:hypothetical protein
MHSVEENVTKIHDDSILLCRLANAKISDFKISIFSIVFQNISIVSIIIDIFKNIKKCQIISKSYGRYREIYKHSLFYYYFLKMLRFLNLGHA